jgi:aspartyl-tRNA(Asn)/glutamyl-tRNA(Gln) amidotransferase subunit C
MAEPQNGVTADDVKKIARLSRLHVEDAACAPIAEDLNGILAWIEQLGEVDVEGVAPMTSAVDMAAPMRKDEISDGGKRDAILKNAPKADDGFFVVPRSVE